MKSIELKPIRETTADFDRMEARIKRAFLKYFYLPIIKELGLPRRAIHNAPDDLVTAINSGLITVSRGTFRGSFDATTSKELKALGAKWDSKTSSFKLATVDQPPEIRAAISAANVRYKERMARIDKKLSEINPENFAGKIFTKDLFASTISKTDREIKKSVKGLLVYPELTPEQQEKIAGEWQNNMDLWIKNFTEKQIVQLRKDVALSASAGNRYESLIKSVQKSYGVTENKAKFLARQETSLLMVKLKETRYTSSGIQKYKWRCVAGTKLHPVRPFHKKLDGSIQTWSNPPIDDPNGSRHNPGENYNCRCVAVPIVEFR